MSLDSLSHMPQFTEVIAEETKRCNQLLDAKQPITTENIHRFSLLEYRDDCRALGKGILTDQLLQQQLDYFEERLYKMRTLLMSGMKVMLTVFPCDANGNPYQLEEVQNNAYFHVLRQQNGLWFGYSGSDPSTHGFMLPKEIQEKCAFVINFKANPPTDPYSIDNEDWQKLKKQFTDAFIALRTNLGITVAA